MTTRGPSERGSSSPISAQARDRNALFDWDAHHAAHGTSRAGAPKRWWSTRRFRRTVISITAVGVVVLVGYLVVPASWYDQAAYERSQGFGRYGDQLDGKTRAALNKELPQLEEFVARHRGGAFLHPVPVEFLPDDQFVSRLGPSDGAGADDAVALGFAKSRQDYQQQLQQLQTEGIVGVYDNDEQTLYIRGQTLDDYANVVLVHELTHAYDDQHYHLTAIEDQADSGDDAAAAATAVIEGDASAVEDTYAETLPEGKRCEVLTAARQPYDRACRAAGYTEADESFDAVGTALEARLQFPYTAGERFIATIARLGGQRAVDQALEHPPVDTAQIIDPEQYLRHRSVAVVPYPHHAGQRAGSLGALELSILLTGGRLTVDGSNYLFGWSGDSHITFQSHRHDCLIDRVQLDNSTNADKAAARFRTWTRSGKDRSYQRENANTIAFTSCN